MKNFVAILGCLLLNTQVFCQINTTFVSQLDYPQNLNAVWGWADDDGTEYALVGTTTGVSIVSLKNPAAPVEKTLVPGPFSTWREMKAWKNHAYITNETGDGLLVINLSSLPDSVSYYYWEPVIDGLGQLSTCHNIYIDENGLCYLTGCNLNSGGVLLVDVASDPGFPKYVGKGRAQYSHDAYARDNLMYSAEIYGGVFSVTDVTDRANPIFLTQQTTPFNFTHNCWLSDDSKTLFTTDERANAPVAAFDVSDLDNIKELDQIRSKATIGTGVIPHNVFVLNDYLVVAYYTDGVIVVDAARPDNLIEVGNYDTYLQAGSGFNGSWGAYPYLPSGLILASDIGNGLFVIQPNYKRACYLEGIVKDASNEMPLNEVQITFNNVSESSKLDGSFKTGTAQAGTYEVTFSKIGYLSKTITANLSNGVVTNLDIELQPVAGFSVSGRIVTASDGRAISNAQVVINNEQSEFVVQTNQDGTFLINNIFENSYTIFAGAWGYLTEFVEQATLNENKTYLIALEEGYQDDFILDLGWSATGNASTGSWERGVPIATNFSGLVSNPGMDIDTDLGNQCYVTGNGGGTAGDDDVDNGNVVLTSPIMDLTNYVEPTMICSVWFFNAGGDGFPNDKFTIKVTNGTDEVILETINASASLWKKLEYKLKDFITITNTMQIIFETADALPGHLVEAAVDGFAIVGDEDRTSSNEDVIANASNVKIYPNPFSGSFRLHLTDKLLSSSYSFRVVDVLGRTVLSKTIHSNITEVQFPAIPSGIYWIQTFDENHELKSSHKLIKQD